MWIYYIIYNCTVRYALIHIRSILHSASISRFGCKARDRVPKWLFSQLPIFPRDAGGSLSTQRVHSEWVLLLKVAKEKYWQIQKLVVTGEEMEFGGRARSSTRESADVRANLSVDPGWRRDARATDLLAASRGAGVTPRLHWPRSHADCMSLVFSRDYSVRQWCTRPIQINNARIHPPIPLTRAIAARKFFNFIGRQVPALLFALTHKARWISRVASANI